MTGELTKFRVGNIRSDFAKLLWALDVIKRKGKETWEVPDVIYRLMTDQNAFFLINGNDVVVLVNQHPVLWCWGLYSENGHAYDYYLPDFKEFARRLGCTSLGFDSARPAYQKLYQKLGAKVIRTTFEIKL